MATKIDNDFAIVKLYNGGFNDSPKVEGNPPTFRIPTLPGATPNINADKLAKARADAARVAALCGWN